MSRIGAPPRHPLPRRRAPDRARRAGLRRAAAGRRRPRRHLAPHPRPPRASTRSTASTSSPAPIICPLSRASAPYDRALLDRAAWGREERAPAVRILGARGLAAAARAPSAAALADGARRPRRGGLDDACGAFARERRAEAEAVLARIRGQGPMAASDFEHGKSRSRLVGMGRRPSTRSNICSGPATSPPRPGAAASSGSTTSPSG